jgi:serine/threonine protein phosphatase 1
MNKHYAISDLHGMYELWTKIKTYCDDTDTIYFLGDAADRGSEGIRLMLELIEHPQVIYLKGNHEDLLYQAIAKKKGIDFDNWMFNGGEPTYTAFKKLSSSDQEKILATVNNLPYHMYYKNINNQKIHLTHAGFTPGTPPLNGVGFYTYPKDNLLWDREHIIDSWPHGYPNSYIVHGHTPVQLLWQFGEYGYKPEEGYCRYCNGHKIDIDNGCFSTNAAIVLDLDTLEPIIIL